MTQQEENQIVDQLCNNEEDDAEEMIAFLLTCTTVSEELLSAIVHCELPKCRVDPFYEPDLSSYF